MQGDWQRRAREVERIQTRYQTEVIEQFSFCPWAREAREQGRVQLLVSFMRAPDVAETLPLLDAVMQQASTDVGMLIFPLLPLSRLPFAHFVADVRRADDLRSRRGQLRFALADFHPDAPYDDRSPDTLVPFLRRSPDPLIQVVRTEVLAHVRGPVAHGTSYVDPAQVAAFALGAVPSATPPLAARVAEHNFRTLRRVGSAEIERIFGAISADRKASYAALDMAAPTHAYNDDPCGLASVQSLEKKPSQNR